MARQSLAHGSALGHASGGPMKPARKATDEDVACNRAQYEPAIRRSWKAQKTFDDFVDAQMKAKCPDRNKYVVVGAAERYEMRELRPEWPRASSDEKINIDTWGRTRVPQDGRYDFDFSKVRTSFNTAAVVNAIARACDGWTREAVAFHLKASSLVKAEQRQAAFNLERSASGWIEPIEDELEAVLNAETPAAQFNSVLMAALQKPKRAN